MISENQKKPLACWRGKERYNGETVECLTVIFESGGCSWARCRMCSYRHERYQTHSCEELAGHLHAQLGWVRSQFRLDEFSMIKIFTSGSFFDPDEVPPAFRTEVAQAFRGKIVIAESRPEYITAETIESFVSDLDNCTHATPLYCAIGLETTNDPIREKCINKGFTYADFTKATAVAHAAGAGVKAYLLFKPIFLTEAEAIADIRSSLAGLAKYVEMISMNPCTVQKRTELELYWRQGAYRPAYLWSVLSILKDAPVDVTCDPLGGGQKRGPHNCGTCDYEITRGIRDYSLTGDRDLIGALLDMDCPCKNEWEYVLAHEQPYCMPLTR
ncbi:MAG: archaeosine biosynthesis radical SAM protein RaSEA [Methanoregula sp.]|uniref:archaeosine biosynthesis radical SAM protein RaSEA n=1 Tax=Methanoregula sp. TaxID=2052170 RepID=UPI003C2A1871